MAWSGLLEMSKIFYSMIWFVRVYFKHVKDVNDWKQKENWLSKLRKLLSIVCS